MASLPTVGRWSPQTEQPVFSPQNLSHVSHRIREAAHIVIDPKSGSIGVGFGGRYASADGFPLIGSLAPLYPEWLGDRSFNEVHHTRFPYVSGAMANGIATEELVISMGKAGFLGFFGAAGLEPKRVLQAVTTIKGELDPQRISWGSNLIHSPNEPQLEEAIVDLYLRQQVRRVSAAAYMKLTPHVVRYAVSGLYVKQNGQIGRKNHLFAKISRPEVAQRFMSPAPTEMIQALLQAGRITQQQAKLAQYVAVAEDYTIESDSGGHTDNQPLGSLFPCIASLRDEIIEKYRYQRPIRLGAAGGLGTPKAVASAFALGAAYVVTGSINQGCVESGLDPIGKEMLAKADLADVVMAPAADMFELGVEVQVLRRGTMFAIRAKKLHHLYRTYDAWEKVPPTEKNQVEKQILGRSFSSSWADTKSYWLNRDPSEVSRAEKDPKHQMALVFRAYLGQSSKWAIRGDKDRIMDYQIWCGPAMGAFNRWAKGSFLQSPSRRSATQVALNLIEGAAVLTRAHQLRSYGVALPDSAFVFRPRPLE